ncbi:MAG: hypothetical protein HZA02_09885 [Nitrospinae bacterium]|nr:hypothetical protein [Nitrospinota bacterium]
MTIEPQTPRERTDSRIFLAGVGGTGIFVLALALIDLLTGETRDWRSIINENSPINPMTATCLIVAGAFAAKVSWRIFGQRDGYGNRAMRWVWPGIAVAFLFGGLDEFFEIHEWIGARMPMPSFIEKTSEGGQDRWFQGLNVVLTLYVSGAWTAFFLVRSVLRLSAYSFNSFLCGLGFHSVAWVCETFFQWAENLPKPWIYVVYLEETSELFGCLFFALAMILLARKLESRARG